MFVPSEHVISQLHLLDADDGHVVDAARRALGRDVVVHPSRAQHHAPDLGKRVISQLHLLSRETDISLFGRADLAKMPAPKLTGLYRRPRAST